LADSAKKGVRANGGVALEFGTITVSDGISMGHEGMRASLVSREVITDSVETVVHAERFDGFIGLAGCDKSIPGMLMAAARLNLPSVFVYNGSTLPGVHNGKNIDITTVFEAIGACAAGTMSQEELGEIERAACPGEGACGGMFTANTMSSIAEALGMSLLGTASPPAIDKRRESDAERAGAAVMNLAMKGIYPRHIMTKKAFENAIAVVNALGGSTNAVLHILAIANEAGVDIDLDDFNRIAAKVPHIADTKPGGKYHMTDVDRIGGVPVVLKHLLDAGLLHGDVMTCSGKTMAESLAEFNPPAPDGDVVHPLSDPIPKAESTSSLDRSRRKVRSSKLLVSPKIKCCSKVKHACSTEKTAQWLQFLLAKLRLAQSLSFVTKGQRAARACAKCLPLLAR
jgi:dihydroxy-acid dehydratase